MRNAQTPFPVWKRRYADVRAGTQAPPLRILLERVARGCSPLRFVWEDYAWMVGGGWQIARVWLVPFGDDCA